MRTFLFILSIFFCLHSFAQTKVSGIVTDNFGDPVAFANVLFQNSNEGTITNENGRFYLESDNNFDILIVSFIGYETQENIL